MSAMQNMPANISLLSPIGFKFALSKFPEVTYFCQAANIPGISVGSIEVGTPRKAVYMPGDEVIFEELSIRFVVDENLKNWLSIYDWIRALGTPTSRDAEQYAKRKKEDELTTEGILTVLTSNMNPQMHVKFHDLFPLSLSGISFDTGATDVEYISADVSFRYDLYEIENLLQNETSYEGAPVYSE